MPKEAEQRNRKDGQIWEHGRSCDPDKSFSSGMEETEALTEWQREGGGDHGEETAAPDTEGED